MKANPDNRTDNLDRIQYSLEMTIDNIHRANEMTEKTPVIKNSWLTQTRQVGKENCGIWTTIKTA